ncbi:MULTISPECIES: acyl-ACP--UDP-N-acetylglucosamine O-acyltransferase [unclassified Pseudodesulfovibrio]|uniref:acyl-ACP--UDP-N-acetylglucosamine O-acyltransferase n=1 Tax=unclassified Pseudodesulfovibrio TaxID=2661612 RepID=UPI000FEB7537|nr:MULTISPECIES: acyl-ACP--UDP-N-acetylglucosamine O-acyltransferase [unclassified Pseudodesulfovibrio]MCJ2163987.1 acyl-ACP--UDP-N-acetylglucosamine O-acyltransferase [Pseudodesulfovibrio sp. S3-i]RWU05373.1 acyl-ACP--UDP-N-acetylglucosamine O-acyltransferase [Pseudodesulfovibrio sp. S3]
MACSIHPSAVIDPTAELGTDVKIGPYVVVGADVSIGDGTYLESHCVIQADTELGVNNHVHPHAVIGGEPQHLAYKGEKTFTRIGDNNVIRECVTIHRGTMQGEGKTSIGSNCMFMAYSHIAHDCTVSDNVILANAVQLAGHVVVGRNVIISGLSAVQQFIRIGEYSFLGGASGYKLDVPPFMLAHGVRGMLFGPNLIGLRRNGFDSAACKGLKKAYKIIFRSGLTKEQSLVQVEQEIPGVPEVARLVAFIRESKNGVTPDHKQRCAHDD